MAAVAILGAGMRTPLGLDRASSAAAVRAGVSVIGEHPGHVDQFGDPIKVTRDAVLGADLDLVDRLTALAVSAAFEAVAPIAGRGASVVLMLTLGEERQGLTPKIAERVVRRLTDVLAEKVRVEKHGVLMGGHAGGGLGIASAIDHLVAGRGDYVLVGGVDSYITGETLDWLDEIGQLHSDGNIYGFCPGEAAGFLLIGRDDGAALIGVVGAGSAEEANLIKTEDICLGHGLSKAFRGASRTLPAHHRVDRIVCDMNGERYRGNEYGFAVLRTPDLFADAADFEAPADCWGDVGAASIPLYACLAVEAEARGYAKGPLTMIWASSESGKRGAVLLARRRSR